VVSWPDHVDDIIGGDLIAVLGLVTRAGGAVIGPVAPLGLRDRERGTVSFTTSLGLGRKLERIREDPRVALAFHAREHGFSSEPGFVLVQGRAAPVQLGDGERAHLEAQAARFLGPLRRGRLFWDRWLREYYSVRIPVEIEVERVSVWPDARCAGDCDWFGEAPPYDPPDPQPPPAKGAGPRVDAQRVARRLAALPHLLLGYVDDDGFPVVAPVELRAADQRGIELAAGDRLLPPGARRAGLLGHAYRPQLVGIETRTHTGWLESGGNAALYAPHTQFGFRAPANKTLLLLANGLMAKRGVRRARRTGTLPAQP
jgi:hypothetical protein